MKLFLFFALLAFGGFQYWSSLKTITPLYKEPYIAVYGEKIDEMTLRFLDNLYLDDVNYKFFEINEETIELLHKRMRQAGLSIKKYNLPIVDVNGSLSIQPSYNQIYMKYSKSI